MVVKVVVCEAKEAKGVVVAHGLAQGLDSERQPLEHLTITIRRGSVAMLWCRRAEAIEAQVNRGECAIVAEAASDRARASPAANAAATERE